jgi:hypothetical protein
MIVYERNSYSHTRSFSYIENFTLFLVLQRKVTSEKLKLSQLFLAV